MVYVPPNTISQHFNADPGKPARIIVITNASTATVVSTTSNRSRRRPEYDPGEQLTAEILRRST